MTSTMIFIIVTQTINIVFAAVAFVL